MLTTNEIKARFESCSKFKGTVKELANLTGIPLKTVYRNKHIAEAVGISLVASKRGRKEKSYVDPSLRDFDVSDFKIVLNGLYHSLGLYVPYSDKEVPFSSYANLNISASNKAYYIDYLRRVSKRIKDLPTTDRYFVMEMLVQLNLPFTYVSGEDAKYYSEVSEELFSLTPTKEQLKVVDNIVRFALGKISPEHPTARVEAVAGASKSFCATIAKTVLERKYDFDTIPILSVSSAVADNNKDGKTIAKEFSDSFGISGDFDNLTALKNIIKFDMLSGELGKKRFIIVDEHSTLGDSHPDIFGMYYQKVLFLGDTAQIRQNTSYMGPVIGTLSEQFRFAHSETDIQKTITRLHITQQTEALDAYITSVAAGTFDAQLGINVEGGVAQVCTKYEGSFDSIYEERKEEVHSLSTQVIAYARRAVKEFNRVANGGTLDIKSGSIVTITRYVHRAGEKGKTGGRFKVLAVNGSECTLYSPEKGVVYAPLSSVELSFAATTSKVQGRGFSTVIFLGGTSCSAQYYADLYSGISRGAKRVHVYLRQKVDQSRAKLMDILLPFIEGKRNNKLSKDLYTYFKEVLKSGLSVREIMDTASSALSGATSAAGYAETMQAVSKLLNKAKDSKPLPEPQELKHNPNAYSYVLVSPEGKYIYPRSEQKNKTKEQAQYALDTALKEGYTGFLTFNLKAQPYVVFDFDNDVEAIDKFKHLLDQTKGAINPEGTSMHLWFEVDKFYNTEHFRVDGKGVDVLANTNETNVNQKPNKTYNTLDPMPLSEEILTLLKDHIKITYNKESRLCL